MLFINHEEEIDIVLGDPLQIELLMLEILSREEELAY